MKNIFRKSVQIFHKKDKGESPGASPSGKKDKKKGGSELNNSSDNFIKSPINGLGSNTVVQDNGADEAQLLNTLQTFVYNPSARKVFGVPLQQVPRRNGSNIPIIVEKLIDHLEKTALTTEGVFRIPGRDILITHYVKLFNNGDDVDVSPIEPYTAAGLLKRFFRDLPVFVPQQINKRVASLFIMEDGKKRQADVDVLSKLRFLVHQLPSVHFEVMQALTGLLSKLMSKSDQNKMTISNIAICLVPTLNCVPAIVTYPIQYFDFFFNEVFNEHHIYHMRPYQTNLITSVMEEKHLEHLSSQPMLIPGSTNNNPNNTNNSENRRYSSRPASITISGLLPNGAPSNSSPSSSTITSTITSPHDSLMFTVTTTFTPPLDDQNNNNNNNINSQSPLNQTQNIDMIQQPQQQQQPYSKAERRGYKLDTLDLTQFMHLDDQQPQQILPQTQQYQSNKNYLSPTSQSNNSNLSSSPNSTSSLINNLMNNSNNSLPPMSQQLQQDMKSLYRRSVAIGNTNTLPSISNEDTKAAIQQIKEKIDRYASNTVNNIKKDRSNVEKEKEKLLRYSIDFERFKDRYQKDKTQIRDINKEIEREIEKRLSPRERANLLLNLTASSTSLGTSNSSPSSHTGSGSGIGSFMKQQQQDKSYRYSVSNNTTQPLYQQLGNNRYSNRFTKSDLNDELYYYEQLMYLQQQQQLNQQPQPQSQSQPQPQQQQPQTQTQPQPQPQSQSQSQIPTQLPSAIPYHVSGSLNRQRSQSCFEPENLISIQQNLLQQQQNNSNTTLYIEQKLDKIKELINNSSNSNSNGDNRVSRDYTHFLKEVDDLKGELQKESVTTDYYASKNLELQDKLRIEEEKNQRLMDEIQLLESYFLLKEKAKLSKRLSTTKELMTRSRSPTLPTSMNPLTGLSTSNSTIPNLNTSSNSINSYSSSPSSSGSSKDVLMNQMLRGPNRNLVNLIPSNINNNTNQQSTQAPLLFVSQPPN